MKLVAGDGGYCFLGSMHASGNPFNLGYFPNSTPTGWSNAASGFSGEWQYRSSSSAVAMTVTFPACRYIDIIYDQTTTSNSVLVSVNGGTATTLTGSGGSAAYSKLYTIDQGAGQSAAGSLTITGSVGSTYINGIRCRQDTSSGLIFYNVGDSGQSLNNFLSGSYTTAALQRTAVGADMQTPDCLFINIGTNDANNNTVTLATWKSNVSTFLTSLSALGCPIVWFVNYNQNVSNTDCPNFGAYIRAGRDVAYGLNLSQLCIVDMHDAWGGYTAAVAAGYQNGLHPTTTGHANLAARIGRAIGVPVV